MLGSKYSWGVISARGGHWHLGTTDGGVGGAQACAPVTGIHSHMNG